MTFGFHYMAKRKDGRTDSTSTLSDNYRLSLDHTLTEPLKRKLVNTHETLVDFLMSNTLQNAYRSKSWAIKLYSESGLGLSKDNQLKNKDEFSGYVIPFNPQDSTDLHRAVGSLLLQLIMEPQAFYVVYDGTDPWASPLLYGDLFRALKPEYLEASNVGKVSKFGTSKFPWQPGGNLAAHISDYEDLMKYLEDENLYFSFRDVRHFKSHHAPRGDSTPIYDHAMATIYKLLREEIWNAKFGRRGGPQDLVDLS